VDTTAGVSAELVESILAAWRLRKPDRALEHLPDDPKDPAR
jgi:hypothetical protein